MHMMRRFRPSEHKFIWGKQVGRLLRTARPKSNPRSSTVNTVAVIEVRPVIPETARGCCCCRYLSSLSPASTGRAASINHPYFPLFEGIMMRREGWKKRPRRRTATVCTRPIPLHGFALVNQRCAVMHEILRAVTIYTGSELCP